jgi:hypothetical protein
MSKNGMNRALVALSFLAAVASTTTAQSRWIKSDAPLKIERSQPGYVRTDGYWLLLSSDPKNQIAWPTVVHLNCDRSEKTCIETYASVENGVLKVDSSEYRISRWDQNGVEADGLNEGLCDIGHRLVLDYKTNSVTLTDYPKHTSTNDLCKAVQQPNTYVLQGGKLSLNPAPEWKLGRMESK